MYKISVRQPEGKKPVGISRSRREDNIKSDFREVGYGVGSYSSL